MNREDALATLQTHAAAVRAMGATALYLYGSTAAGQATAASDVDVYVDYDPEGRFNAFDLVGIQQFLETRLGRRVDIATRDGLHPRLRERIETSAIMIFSAS